MKYGLLLFFILSSASLCAQESSEDYAVIIINPRSFSKYEKKSYSLKPKDFYIAMVDDRIAMTSSSLNLKHKGILSGIGSDHIEIDGVKYLHSDISGITVSKNHFFGATLIKVYLKTMSIYAGLAAIFLLADDAPSESFVAAGLAGSLWWIGSRLGSPVSNYHFEENEDYNGQFSVRKLVLDPSSLPKD